MKILSLIPSALSPRRPLSSLSEREVLALAIENEAEDARIYREFAERLRADFPASAEIFVALAKEEDGHHDRLLGLFRQRFGEHVPLIRRADVGGFSRRRPVWMFADFNIEAIRERAEAMEAEAAAFYERAARQATDPDVRKLLDELAAIESGHEAQAGRLAAGIPEATRQEEAETARRNFVLRIVQPGLVGLMDGSVSTLAPVFAAAFATHDSWATFLVGIAASVGAGISMGFAEALSDDGSLSGRGSPIVRGVVTGLMTAVGGVGHTLPYLIPDFRAATALAILVVLLELWAIAWVRARYMETPFWRAAFQIVVGGLLVFAAGVLIGSA